MTNSYFPSTHTYIKSRDYKSVTEILREEYNEFLANFDPSPQNYGDAQHTRHDELGDRHFMTVGIAERAATRQVFGFQKFVTRKRHLIEFEVGDGWPIALNPTTDHRIGLDDQLSEAFERFVFRPNLYTPIRGELFRKPFGARLGHPAGQKNG